MKSTILIILILVVALPLFAADNAVVREVTGRVEVQMPGSGWKAASVGDSIPKGAGISTGFRSSAVLEVGASVLSVDALTRMKLEELIQDQGVQTTGLFLRVGKVNAEVKRDTGLSHDFKLRSPSSTAAVRGTNFSFDGKKVTVHAGAVALISQALAREVIVAQGESSEVSGNGKQSDPASEKSKHSSTPANTVKTENSSAQSSASQNSSDGGSTPSPAGGGVVDMYGDITVTIE